MDLASWDVSVEGGEVKKNTRLFICCEKKVGGVHS